MSRPGGTGALLALLLVSFALNLWGISFGLPAAGTRAWDHDEIVPEHVLRSLRHGLSAGTWPVKYPAFHYYLLAPPVRALIRLRQAGYLTATDLQTEVFYVIRAVSVLMATLAILFFYLAAREALDRRGAWLAAAIAALIAPSVYYAKLGNLDMPCAFWLCLSLWLYFRLLRRHRLLDYMGFAAAAAMAVGTKDPAYALYLAAAPTILVSLHRHRRVVEGRGAAAGLLLDRRLALAAGAGAAVFLLGHGIPWDPHFFHAHLRMIRGGYAESYRFFERSLHGQWQCLELAARNTRFCLGWPLLAACLGGIVTAWRGGRGERRFLLFAAALLAIGYYAGFVAVILYSYERYFIPIALVLALFGGDFLARLLGGHGLRRALGTAAVVAVLGHGLARVVVMDLMMVNDSRYRVESWLAVRTDSREEALSIGDPRRGPRLATVSWSAVAASGGEELARTGPRFLVVNVTDTLESQARGRPVHERLAAGDLGYELRRVERYRPPLDLLDARGTTGSLFFINPELAIFERPPDVWFERCRSLTAADPAPLVDRAARKRQGRRFAAARALDERALASGGGALAAIGLGLDCAGLGDHEEAERALRLATELSPESAGPPLALARFLSRRDRLAEARTLLAGALALDPRSPPLWLAQAELERLAGEPGAAYRALERAEAAAAAEDSRLLADLAAEYRAIGAHARAARLLAAGGPDAGSTWQPFVQHGLHALQRSDAGELRWSEGCVAATLEDPGRDAALEIDYRCGPGPPRRAYLRLGADSEMQLACGGERRLERVALPRRLWRGRPFLAVELFVEPAFVPAELWGSDDWRELGLQLFSWRAVPGRELPGRHIAATVSRHRR